MPHTSGSTRFVAHVLTAATAGLVAWLLVGFGFNVVAYVTADATDERTCLHDIGRVFSPWAVLGGVAIGICVFVVARRGDGRS